MKCRADELARTAMGASCAWYKHRTGAAYLAASPAKKKIAKLCDAIGEQTTTRWNQLDEAEMFGRLNRKPRGWANYFDLGSVSRAYHAVNYHVTSRLRRWLCGKHKVKGPGYSRYPDRVLYLKLGLYQLNRSRKGFPNATEESRAEYCGADLDLMRPSPACLRRAW